MARTTTMTVRINGPLSDFVAANVGEDGEYENVSEYIRDLIRRRASALGIDIVETGHFAQILGRKASKKYLSSVAIFPFLRCQNKSRQF